MSDEQAQPIKQTADLSRLAELAARPRETFEYTVPEIGTFSFRKLTGAEVESLTQDAGGKDGRTDMMKFQFLLANKSAVEPKISTVVWAQLGQLDAGVRAQLSHAVFVQNAIIPDVEQAKNA